MMVEQQIVFVVDDDPHMREALYELLTPLGWRVRTFGSAAEYTAFARPDLPACLVLDVELPDINGLEFQEQIADGDHPPIIFMTGHGDVSSSVRAMKGGAIDFLTKPFRKSALIGAIHAAIGQDRVARLERAKLARLQQRFSALTPREREVLPLVASGLLNKQAAAELGISEVTLQIHRGRIMPKNGSGVAGRSGADCGAAGSADYAFSTCEDGGEIMTLMRGKTPRIAGRILPRANHNVLEKENI